MNHELKKLLIDGRMVSAIPHGFARYVSRLADGLRMIREQSGGLAYDPIFIVNASTDSRAFHEFRTVEIGSSFLSFKELFEIPHILKKEKAAAYHSPTFSSLLWAPCPWMVTVHDLNHLTYGGIKERIYYQSVLRSFATRAARLLTVSEFSRQQISFWLSVPEARIEVAPNALSSEFFVRPSFERISAVLRDFGLNAGKYFFCLSNPKPHKNVPFLIQAHEQARRGRKRGEEELWPLVISMRNMVVSETPGVIELGHLSEEQAHCLMFGAGALVFPSLYEGFGLPPVEAASIGIPILISDITPHREALRDLGADEALWADPRDLSAWAQALVEAQQRPCKLTPESMERVRTRYSVANLGRLMDRIYRDVLETK